MVPLPRAPAPVNIDGTPSEAKEFDATPSKAGREAKEFDATPSEAGREAKEFDETPSEAKEFCLPFYLRVLSLKEL
jgi:hypothetical protein